MTLLDLLILLLVGDEAVYPVLLKRRREPVPPLVDEGGARGRTLDDRVASNELTNLRGGCLVSIALGFVGALIGMWLARQMGLPELFAIQIGTTNFPIVWSIIGSALFVAVIALLTRRYY